MLAPSTLGCMKQLRLSNSDDDSIQLVCGSANICKQAAWFHHCKC